MNLTAPLGSVLKDRRGQVATWVGILRLTIFDLPTDLVFLAVDLKTVDVLLLLVL